MICGEKKLICLIIFLLAGPAILTGCSQPDYKGKADETVYNIIDRKWQDDYGSKANYKISDVEPSANDINIERIIPACGVLTLAQAVQIATAHNRQYQLEKELLYISALDLSLARHVFETQFFGVARGEYTKDGDVEAVGTQGSIGFNQLLSTGAIISTNVTLAWIDILTGDVRSGLTSLISATVTQPLLRGSDSKIVMENLTQAERDTIYQIRSFNRFRKTFVVSVISQYYFVLQQYDFLKNAENNSNVLVDIYNKTENLAGAGRLPRYELDRVRQEKLDAKDIFIQAEKNYKQALDEFKISLGLPPAGEFKLDENELTALNVPVINKSDFSNIENAIKETALPEEKLELLELIETDQASQAQYAYAQHPSYNAKLQLNNTPFGFSESDVIETALTLRLDLANKNDGINDAERKVAVAKDSLRAGLNLTAGANYSSLGSSHSITELGLELDLPLDRTAEANQYRKALIILNQRRREFEEATDIVTLEVRRAYRDLLEAAQRYRVQLESVELARKRLNNTRLLMQYGRANSRRVLDAQADIFDAQNAATEALMNYVIAVLSFYRDTGVLQVKPDGMWKY